MERFIKEMPVFAAGPEVPSDNNCAERSLRPLVIARKISAGTRSERGTETWTAQGINPLTACRQLLAGRAARPRPGGAGVPGPPPPPPRGLPTGSRPQLCAQPAWPTPARSGTPPRGRGAPPLPKDSSSVSSHP